MNKANITREAVCKSN